MLPRSLRVNRELFSLIFKKGNAFRSPSLFFKMLPQSGVSRFAVVAEKKTAKNSAARNRIRRRGYYALSKNRKKITAGAAGIFFIKKEISFVVLEEEINDILRRAKLIK